MSKVVYLSPSESGLINYKPSPTALARRFRKWHVEALLNQAADLLDRCLRDRSAYDTLAVSAFLLTIEIDAADRAVAITQREIDDSFYNTEEAILDLEILTRTSKQPTGNSVVDHFYQASEHSYVHGNPLTAGAYAYLASMLQADIARDLNSLALAQSIRKKTAEASRKRSKLQSHEDTKALLNKKKNETTNGQVLDYVSQLNPIGKRIKNDFTDAYDRCTVAYNGLKDFYGYDVALPTLDRDKDDFGPIDECVIWTRDAIRWLAAFSQLDQEWSISFSVRKLVDVWEPTLIFPIPSDAFVNHTYVRLRGISAFVETQVSGPIFPWSAVISLPPLATVRQVDENETITTKELDQSELPSCHLGRIQSRYDPRPPEVAGAVSLMNASPIGKDDGLASSKWAIRIKPPHNQKQSFADLVDLEVELRLAGRPTKHDGN